MNLDFKLGKYYYKNNIIITTKKKQQSQTKYFKKESTVWGFIFLNSYLGDCPVILNWFYILIFLLCIRQQLLMKLIISDYDLDYDH